LWGLAGVLSVRVLSNYPFSFACLMTPLSALVAVSLMFVITFSCPHCCQPFFWGRSCRRCRIRVGTPKSAT
jgi:hypothetical protein